MPGRCLDGADIFAVTSSRHAKLAAIMESAARLHIYGQWHGTIDDKQLLIAVLIHLRQGAQKPLGIRGTGSWN